LTKLEKYDVDCLVIGGGVSGVAVARTLSTVFENIFLVEKNQQLAQETSSRNSEVIHAGIYYDKDSLKSKLCLQGKVLLYEYLEGRNIGHNRCGKFVVSTSDEESERLSDLYNNAIACGVNDLTYDDSLKAKYPFICFKESIFSPSTGIFDSHSFIQSLSRDFQARGGTILLGNETSDISQTRQGFEVVVEDRNANNQFIINCRVLINCAGLNAVSIAQRILGKSRYKEKFVKGEYYVYQGKEKLDHLIYPTPNQNSIGLHATIDLGRGIRFGPSAFVTDEIDYNLSENRKLDFLHSIQSYWPSVQSEDLIPGYSGVRPKLEGVEDFIIDSGSVGSAQHVNILGYASPGLTSSLALANEVLARLS